MGKLLNQDEYPNQGGYRPAHMKLRIGILLAFMGFPALGFAYVGPGAGITMLGALWAVVLAVVFVIGGILIWPIRCLLRKRKNAGASDTGAVDASDTSEKVDS